LLAGLMRIGAKFPLKSDATGHSGTCSSRNP
jgi:hypothetical protein